MNTNMKSLKYLLAITALSLSTFAFGQTVLDANLVDGNLPRATQAEKADVNLNLLKKYKSAAKERKLNINSIMVLRHGKVVYEEWFGRNKPKDLHVMYSVTKTWNMTAIGFAVDEGLISLDDKVISFFPDMLPEVVTEKLGAMKVRHLLTMTTGNIENEINARRRENPKEDMTPLNPDGSEATSPAGGLLSVDYASSFGFGKQSIDNVSEHQHYK